MGESNITKGILQLFAPPLKAVKIHVDQYQEAGTPDVFACVDGRLWVIEVKRPGEEPEPIQNLRLHQWHRAGAYTLVAYDKETVAEVLKKRGDMSERLMLPVVAGACGNGPASTHWACECVLKELFMLKDRLTKAEDLLMRTAVKAHFTKNKSTLQQEVADFLRKDQPNG